MNTQVTAELHAAPFAVASACVSRQAVVFHLDGVHIQPAVELAALAGQFQSVVGLEVDGRAYKADSLIEILSAHLGYGTAVTVTARGVDAESAVAALERFFRKQPQASRQAPPVPGNLAGRFRRAA